MFSAEATATASGTDSFGKVVTSSASATATSIISQQNALEEATLIAQSVANSQLKTDINLINQSVETSVDVIGTGSSDDNIYSESSLAMISSFGAPLQDVGRTWTQVTSSSLPSNVVWSSVSISATGQYQTAVIGNPAGPMYISSNSGVDWSLVAINAPWKCVSISDTGQYQTAVSNTQLHISSKYGTEWFQVQIDGLLPGSYWTSVSVSASGKYQTAVTNSQIYISSNYGFDWSLVTSIFLSSPSYWSSVSISASGQYQTAVTATSNTTGGGKIYISSDAGISWTKVKSITQGSSNFGFKSVSISASGTYITAVAFDEEFIYVSSDGGASWVPKVYQFGWQSVSISATGQYQVAASSQLYISSDFGSTWSVLPTPVIPNLWTSVSISASGRYITAAADGIYISSTAVIGGLTEGTVTTPSTQLLPVTISGVTYYLQLYNS